MSRRAEASAFLYVIKMGKVDAEAYIDQRLLLLERSKISKWTFKEVPQNQPFVHATFSYQATELFKQHPGENIYYVTFKNLQDAQVKIKIKELNRLWRQSGSVGSFYDSRDYRRKKEEITKDREIKTQKTDLLRKFIDFRVELGQKDEKIKDLELDLSKMKEEMAKLKESFQNQLERMNEQIRRRDELLILKEKDYRVMKEDATLIIDKQALYNNYLLNNAMVKINTFEEGNFEKFCSLQENLTKILMELEPPKTKYFITQQSLLFPISDSIKCKIRDELTANKLKMEASLKELGQYRSY